MGGVGSGGGESARWETEKPRFDQRFPKRYWFLNRNVEENSYVSFYERIGLIMRVKLNFKTP